MVQMMSVVIRGKFYPSVPIAAKALKVATATIYDALSRGNIDRVGLGVDYKKRRNRGGSPKPITIAGKTFPSMAELARSIGRSPKAVRASLCRGKEARLNITMAVLKLIAEQENIAMRKTLRTQDKEAA